MGKKLVFFNGLIHIICLMFSPLLACRVQAYILPLIVKNRKGSDVHFVENDGLLMAVSKNQEITFYSARRAARYIFPSGICRVQKKMFRKYLPERYWGKSNAFSVIIEVGTNIGEFSLSVAPFCQKLIVFEPDPLSYRCLIKNLSGFDHVVFSEFALSDWSGTSVFHISSDLADSSLIKPIGNSKEVDVEVRRMDDVLPDFGVIQSCLIKIEAEGAEPEVLRGATRTLQCATAVTVDVSPERAGESTEAAVESILLAAGFKIEKPSAFVVYGEK